VTASRVGFRRWFAISLLARCAASKPKLMESVMRPLSFATIAALMVATNVAAAQNAQKSRKTASDATSANSSPVAVVHSATDTRWGPVPPVLPAGAQIAVLQGNPSGPGVYTLRLKMPDGYIVPPHSHPTDEMVTVVSGTLLFAHGDSVDRDAATTLHAGGFITAPKGMHHYVIARGATIVQVHGMGPFAITYVHPQDDPQSRSK
jgi:quercetin dioxygenase-like cupin family protein